MARAQILLLALATIAFPLGAQQEGSAGTVAPQTPTVTAGEKPDIPSPPEAGVDAEITEPEPGMQGDATQGRAPITIRK